MDEPIKKKAKSPEPEKAAKDPGDVTVINLKANPMKALGLAGYGSATFTAEQLAKNPMLIRKLERGVELGLLKVEE